MFIREERRKQSVATAVCVLCIFILNAIICRPLFRTHWANHMFSIEAAYISLTRYVMENFPDLTWFPLWNAGEPFQATYQPGLPLISAFVTKLFRTDAAHGYHIAIALFYCIGPVGIFFLTCRLSGRREIGVAAAVLFSIFSPSAFVPLIRHDMGGFLFARRFQALAYYGEGPNVSGLNIVPFALWGIDAVYRRLTPLRFALAAAALGATVIVSWPASVVLAVGALAYLLSRDWAEARGRLLRLAALAVTGYLLIAPLDLPSTIRDNQRNSQLIGGNYRYTPAHALYFTVLVLALVLSRYGLRRLRVARLFEFGWYWFLIPGAVALCAFFLHIALFPQPERFHVGMELGLTICLASLAVGALDRLGPYRRSAWIILAVLALIQARTYARYVRGEERPLDITGTLEYQVSRWLDTHFHGERIFLTGSVEFWENAWSDQPQVDGCCLPGMPNPMSWVVSYVIPSGDGAGSHDEEISELWLRTWGAQAVVEGGPKSRDSYQSWWHPHKFDAAFPLVWQQGDDRIYRIPTRTTSLAHVIHPSEIIGRSPVNGLDVEPMRPYVRALLDPSRNRAGFTWLNRHQARIAADVPDGDLISVQETWHPGWRATASGRPVAIRRDAMGFILLAPEKSGPVNIDLQFDGGGEARFFTTVSAIAWAGLLAWIVFWRRKRLVWRRKRLAARA